MVIYGDVVMASVARGVYSATMGDRVQKRDSPFMDMVISNTIPAQLAYLESAMLPVFRGNVRSVMTLNPARRASRKGGKTELTPMT